MKKKCLAFAFLLLTASMLTACGFRTVQEMYRFPKRPQEYTLLQSTIQQAMVGLEFASPITGENQQTIQTADLDGDGREEYLVFARENAERPLKVLVFHETQDGQYYLLEMLNLNGAAFERVEYADMDGRPGKELVIGRRLSNQMMRVVAVYTFADGQSSQLINTIYSKFLATDLDEDGITELLVIREGDTDVSAGSSVVYTLGDGSLERSREIRLSQRVEQIKRVKVSRLQSGEPAVYVSSTINDSAIVTDVLMVKNGEFLNLNSTGKLAYSVKALRNYYLYLTDIDEDGIMELPSLMDMRSVNPDDGNSEPQQLVYWYSIDSQGSQTPKMFTFHNMEGGWYLQMNLTSDEAEHFCVEREGQNLDFYIWDEDYQHAKLLFSIHALTGKDRLQSAVSDNRFILYQTDSVVYVAKLEVSSAAYGITQEGLIGSFRMMGMDLKKEG